LGGEKESRLVDHNVHAHPGSPGQFDDGPVV
ncbi:uncharacterized protein METZ01_LOCUS152204, partial [marine metagenome]